MGEVPILTFDTEKCMVISHAHWDHKIKVMRGVVLIHAKDLMQAELHGWLQMPRATNQREVELGLIRVCKL